MNLDEIRELIRLMRENQIGEIDLQIAGDKVRLVAEAPAPAPAPAPTTVYLPPMAGMPLGQMPMAPASVPGASGDATAAPAEAEETGFVIKSPIVGVFYATPSPDQPVFVEEGQEVDESTVMCIIEAMKVMNEIKAETSGVLRKVLVQHGQSVEYGQPLFIIDPA